MKKLMAVVVGLVGSVYLTYTASAGMPDADVAIVPTSDLSGGMITLSVPFGAGARHVEQAAADDAGGVGGSDSIWSAIGNHLADNWGKWLTGAAVVVGAGMVMEHNDVWPFDAGADDDTAKSTASTGAGASAGSGGTVTYISITGDGNVVAGDDVNIAEAAGE